MRKLTTIAGKMKLAEAVGLAALLAIFILPVASMAKKSHNIYVNAGAAGTQDGSSSHPYKTISKALESSRDGDKIHIANGEYKENIHVREGRELYGESKSGVVIKAKDDDYEVVDMDDDTALSKATIKGGKYGIRVGKNEKASVINCIIKDNDKHGVLLEESKTDDKYKVSITKSIIKDNGKIGVFSAKRRLVMIDNEVVNNGGDGLLIGAWSRVWLDNNSFNSNEGSGVKIYFDGADIWTKDNNFSKNEREGIEINAYGSSGILDLKDNTIKDNYRYGIARVQRANFPLSVWNGAAIHSDNDFLNNKFGNISNILRIY